MEDIVAVLIDLVSIPRTGFAHPFVGLYAHRSCHENIPVLNLATTLGEFDLPWILHIQVDWPEMWVSIMVDLGDLTFQLLYPIIL